MVSIGSIDRSMAVQLQFLRVRRAGIPERVKQRFEKAQKSANAGLSRQPHSYYIEDGIFNWLQDWQDRMARRYEFWYYPFIPEGET